MNGLKMVLEHQGLPNFSNAGLQPALQLYAAAAAHLAPRNRVPPWAPFLQFGVPGVFGSPFLTRPRFGPTPGGGPPGLAGLNGLNGIGGPHQLPNNRTMPGPPSEDSNEDREHHVHFDTTTLKDEFESENGLTYQKSGDSIVVHLGFLQINHRYLIELKLPATLFKCNAEPITLVPENEAMPNIHCKLVEFSGKSTEQSDFIDVKVEYFAHKEKLLKEELKLINATNSEELLKLVITARVLGKGKGTPMLRNGIHCVGVQEDEESEASDFQGFGTN